MNKILIIFTTLLFLLIGSWMLCSCSSTPPEEFIAGPNEIDKFLHLPSPNWEDQILYFIVTDRFMDGDTTNNDQGEGEYKKGEGRFWNGGDLKGITQKIDYIKELGATGIWITPPVANQWRNPEGPGTGNHGYWASSFVEVDKHLGTLEDYKKLSATLHKNDMYLIQDVVCNHFGDFYTYTGTYNPDDVTENFKLREVSQPTQYPFNHNNALDSVDRAMAIYHFAPSFHDHSDSIKKRAYQFADLDDLNTANPVVREALRSSFNHWIGEVGVDGFRFDTPHFVEHDFWHDFIHSEDEAALGVEKFAKTTGRDRFFTFGETVMQTLAYHTKGSSQARGYLGTVEKPQMTSVLNFPLYNEISRVFVEKRSTDLLTFRLEYTEQIFDHPEMLLNFIDNHDGARFLTRASHESFRQALLFIMTIPGIPVIYYGTEQELLGMRQAMFQGGAGSPDHDHFNTDNSSFRFMQKLIEFRKHHTVFRKGKLKILRDNSGGSGLFIYELKHEMDYAVVMFNTSGTTRLADRIPTNFKAGSSITTDLVIDGTQRNFVVDLEGNLNVELPANAGMVLLSGSEIDYRADKSGEISIDPLDNRVISSDRITISGKSQGVEEISLAIDGNVEKSISAEKADDGNWSAELLLAHLINGKHRLTAFSIDSLISDHLEFQYIQQPILIAEYADSAGDDHGPGGIYGYPTNPGFDGAMDIREVEVYSMGTNLRVDITMAETSRIWIGPNDFDHVLFNIYIDLPGIEGISKLPRQNMSMPAGAAWDYRVTATGFGNKTYSSEDATDSQMGKLTGPSTSIKVNHEKNIISFMISSESLDYPSKLSGAKMYINTWDGSAENPRNLVAEPAAWSFSGGTNDDPKFMDDTELIILK